MNFIEAAKGNFTFHIDAREKQALFQILGLYPLVPASYQKLSRAGARPEDQKLLEESLESQRRESKRQVLAMLNSKTRFQPHPHGFRFTLKAGQVEWLLQVLNDIRIGSWLQLGSPDGPEEMLAVLNEKTASHFVAMEIAGHFQSTLLGALQGEPPTKPPMPPVEGG